MLQNTRKSKQNQPIHKQNQKPSFKKPAKKERLLCLLFCHAAFHPRCLLYITVGSYYLLVILLLSCICFLAWARYLLFIICLPQDKTKLPFIPLSTLPATQIISYHHRLSKKLHLTFLKNHHTMKLFLIDRISTRRKEAMIPKNRVEQTNPNSARNSFDLNFKINNNEALKCAYNWRK